MKFEELFDQMEQIKKAFIQAGKDYDCDDVKLVFRTDEGKMVHINCIESGYAPDAKSNVLVFSSGKKELEQMLRALIGTPTHHDIGNYMNKRSIIYSDDNDDWR